MLFIQFQLIFFAEIICNTINFCNFADKLHRGLFCRYLSGFQQQIHEKKILFWAFIETILRQKITLAYPELGLPTLDEIKFNDKGYKKE